MQAKLASRETILASLEPLPSGFAQFGFRSFVYHVQSRAFASRSP